MANVIIVHGTGSSPQGNWFPWLKAELEKLGCTVFVPEFPTPKGQSLEGWLKVFRKYDRYVDKDTVLIGHSLGVAFLLSVLERVQRPVKAAFFVAGFIGLLRNRDFDELNKAFTAKRFDWLKIKKSCRRFYVINSDNDPYVTLAKGEELAENLGTHLIILKNAGHINKDSGYMTIESVLERIKKEI
ncbi:serine hydrolase family protein [Candidatus Woesearchaeota archaeon]|nr:serine hydrolase family protein [Candidatus Woesearchaeota archaeon]